MILEDFLAWTSAIFYSCLYTYIFWVLLFAIPAIIYWNYRTSYLEQRKKRETKRVVIIFLISYVIMFILLDLFWTAFAGYESILFLPFLAIPFMVFAYIGFFLGFCFSKRKVKNESVNIQIGFSVGLMFGSIILITLIFFYFICLGAIK